MSELEVLKYQTLLEASESGLNEIPSGCCAGACGQCVTLVLSGNEYLSTIEEREAKCLEVLGLEVSGKYRLACQAQALNDGYLTYSLANVAENL